MQWPDGNWASPCLGDYGCTSYATVSHGFATFRSGPDASGCTESWASYLTYQGGFVTFTPDGGCTAFPSYVCTCASVVETATFRYDPSGRIYIGDGTVWSRISDQSSSSDHLMLIIGLSVAGFLVILVMVAVVLWQRHKKARAIEVPPLHVPIMDPVVVV